MLDGVGRLAPVGADAIARLVVRVLAMPIRWCSLRRKGGAHQLASPASRMKMTCVTSAVDGRALGPSQGVVRVSIAEALLLGEIRDLLKSGRGA